MLKEQMPLKILILMSYYNRPLLVRNTLKSILKANEYHSNWELLFGDDGSKVPGKPIAEEILKDHLSKVKFVNSNMTFEDKIDNGLLLGKYANQFMMESDADVAIMLCDDDELVPTYLKNLSEFFIKNPSVLYCYSKIHIFNPFFQTTDGVNNTTGKFNQWTEPINPVAKVDATQVAWRLDCCKKYGAWFQESTKFIDGKPWTRDTDRGFFENLYQKCGLCYPTGFVGQFKAVHDYQLLWHKDVGAASLWAYDQMCRELGGVKF
jgi:glycosyltransferase involved in cell wall biosynthesis